MMLYTHTRIYVYVYICICMCVSVYKKYLMSLLEIIGKKISFYLKKKKTLPGRL